MKVSGRDGEHDYGEGEMEEEREGRKEGGLTVGCQGNIVSSCTLVLD